MEAGQRPVRLARVVLRPAVDLRLETCRCCTARSPHQTARSSPPGSDRGGAADRRSSVSPVSWRRSTKPDASKAAPPVGARPLSASVVQSSCSTRCSRTHVMPRSAARQRIGLTGTGGLVEAHDGTGVSNEVVTAEIAVGRRCRTRTATYRRGAGCGRTTAPPDRPTARCSPRSAAGSAPAGRGHRRRSRRRPASSPPPARHGGRAGALGRLGVAARSRRAPRLHARASAGQQQHRQREPGRHR